MTFDFTNNIPREGPGVAIVAVAGIGPGPLPGTTEEELRDLLDSRRAAALPEREERVRAAGRNMLRNGSYKPTGRGKPASEYLLGAAKEGVFPRVNALVDINNLVSLKYLLPISLWDADLCSSAKFEFRLGRPGERYVFNPSGQELDLEDLVCGCEVTDEEGSRAIVTPIKDGMRTKVRPETRTVLGAIYFPAEIMDQAAMDAVNGEFLDKLRGISAGEKGEKALLLPGESRAITI